MVETCDPAEPLGYGDVCWIEDGGRIPFFDVHVRPDVTPLRALRPESGETDSPGLAPAMGHIKPNVDHAVLAHGEIVAAVLVDDPCQIEDVLGRGSSPNGRLLCATVRGSAGPDEMQLTQKFSLLPVDGLAEALNHVKPFKHGAIVDVERLFSVHIAGDEDLAWLTSRRIGRLTEEAGTKLLWRMAAHTVRRGPLVAEDAARKLQTLLDQLSHPNSAAVADTFSALFGTLFGREGEIEDAISLLYDEKHDSSALPAALDGLYASIEQLAAEARAALAQS